MRVIRECCAFGVAILVWGVGLAMTALIMLILIGLLTRHEHSDDDLAGLGYYLLGGFFLVLVALPFWILAAEAAYRKIKERLLPPDLVGKHTRLSN